MKKLGLFLLPLAFVACQDVTYNFTRVTTFTGVPSQENDTLNFSRNDINAKEATEIAAQNTWAAKDTSIIVDVPLVGPSNIPYVSTATCTFTLTVDKE